MPGELSCLNLHKKVDSVNFNSLIFERKIVMGRKKKSDESISPTGEVKTIRGSDGVRIPETVVPVVVDERIYAETQSIPSLTETIHEKNHQMVNATRNVFNHSEYDATAVETDKKFISSLIAETCCSEHRRLDETLMRAVIKNQLYDDTLKKMADVDCSKLYNDVVSILDISYRYAQSNVENIASMGFHNKLSGILRKYNPNLIDKLNQVQIPNDSEPQQLENNKNDA